MKAYFASLCVLPYFWQPASHMDTQFPIACSKGYVEGGYKGYTIQFRL